MIIFEERSKAYLALVKTLCFLTKDRGDSRSLVHVNWLDSSEAVTQFTWRRSITQQGLICRVDLAKVVC